MTLADAIETRLRRGSCHGERLAECAGCQATDALVAQMRARLALPVIESCHDCSSIRLVQGGSSYRCMRLNEHLRSYDDDSPLVPAQRCPLRGAAQ